MPSVARWTRSILLLLLAAAPGYAQFETASVVGTVRDTTNPGDGSPVGQGRSSGGSVK